MIYLKVWRLISPKKRDYIVTSIDARGRVCFRCRERSLFYSKKPAMLLGHKYLLACFDKYDQHLIKKISRE